MVSWFKNPFANTPNPGREVSGRILEEFQKLSGRIPTVPEVIDYINYQTVISYFRSEDLPKATQGVIILKNHHEGHLLAQVFIDDKNHLALRPDSNPYGQQLVARRIDKKLADIFRDNKLVVVELKYQKSVVDLIHQDLMSQFATWLQDVLRMPELIPVMTYEESIQYFVNNRPADSRVKKGAILRQTHPQGQHLVQVFLDKNNQLVRNPEGRPYGRQLVAQELDEELWDTFDGQDLIIVE